MIKSSLKNYMKPPFIVLTIIVALSACNDAHYMYCNSSSSLDSILIQRPYLELDSEIVETSLIKRIPYENAILSRTTFTRNNELETYQFFNVFDSGIFGWIQYKCNVVKIYGDLLYVYSDLCCDTGDTISFTLFSAAPPMFQTNLVIAEVEGETENIVKEWLVDEESPLTVIYLEPDKEVKTSKRFIVYCKITNEYDCLMDTLDFTIDYKARKVKLTYD
jgi:hypothetical protein